MAKTLKCNKCKDKYRAYPVYKFIDGIKIRHYSYVLYKENGNLKFYEVQRSVGRETTDIDYDKKGKVVCGCPKCHQLMVAV